MGSEMFRRIIVILLLCFSALTCLFFCSFLEVSIFVTPEDGSHSPILLKSSEKLPLGRSRQTNIRDKRVSKTQVELVNENKEDPVVTVNFIGKHHGQLNSSIFKSGEKREMRENDVLCLLRDDYKYKLVIEAKNCPKGVKRSRQDDDGDGVVSSSKKLKSDLKTEDSDLCLKSKDEYKCTSEVREHNKKSAKRKQDNEEVDMPLTKQSKFDFSDAEDSANEDINTDDDLEHSMSVDDKLKKLKQTFGCYTSKNEEDQGVQSSSANEINATEKSFWHEGKKLLIYSSKGLLSSEKIASFDLDGTLITTQSGKVFPTSTSDWKLLFPEVPGRLKELHKNGYKIVIFSNQLGLAKGKVGVGEFKKKVENIVQKINIPMQVYIASGPGIYRKPCFGMWKELEKEGNDGIKIDKQKSFYIGDAAGRPKDWQPGKKKDFSCSDRLFAMNVGELRFETPEEFFLKQSPAKHDLPTFDPRNVDLNEPLVKDPAVKLLADKQEVVVMVGYPASGKSHFVKNHLLTANYLHVNRDTLGSWQKCLQRAQEALKDGKSVAIDNTNPDKESRKRYVALAKEMKVPCRCFVMSTSPEHSRHNEKFREMTDKQHQVIGEMIFNSYKSKYEKPDLSEGFSEVVHINLVPQFSSNEDRKLYQQFLLEK